MVLVLLTGCSDEIALPDNAQVHAIEGAHDAALSQNGRYSIVSSMHHNVSVWDNQSNALMYVWQQDAEELNHVFITRFAADDSAAALASRDTVSLWRLDNGENMGYWQVKDASIRDMALSNRARHLLLGKGDGKVVFIDMVTRRRLEFLGHQEKINTVALSPNGRFALTGSNDYVAHFWDTQSAQVIHSFRHTSRVTKVQLDPQGRYAFTADSKDNASIWDLRSGERVSQLQFLARQKVFSTVRFSPDANYLATGSPRRQITLWRVSDGEHLAKFTVTPRKDSRPAGAVVYDVAFSSDGTQLFSESSAGLRETWQLEGL